eukprot:scaffold120872_cov57-Phaeocystis_antarctica.AAC.1
MALLYMALLAMAMLAVALLTVALLVMAMLWSVALLTPAPRLTQDVGVSGAGGLMEAAKEEELAAEEEAEEALEEDVWALMKAPWDEDAASEAGMDDDF